MNLLVFHCRRRLWLLPLMGGFYIFIVLLQKQSIFSTYHNAAELFPSLVVSLLSAFVLTSNTENEFARCYGVPFTKLGFFQWLPHLIYPLAVALLSVPIWFFLHGDSLESFGKISYAAISFSLFITFLLGTSFILLVRILIRNLYAAIASFLIVFSPLYTFHRNLLLHQIPISYAKYDIWITGLLYSDAYDVSMETWLWNRFACLGIAILFMIMAFLLLKQKNYENIR